MRSRRLPALAAASLAALLVLTGCGGDAKESTGTVLDKITVTGGDDKTAPTVTVTPQPLTVTQTTTRVVKAGTGATIKVDEIVSLKYVLLNGKDSSVLDSNFGKANLGLRLGAQDLLPGLNKGLANQKVGSRILVAMPPADAFGEKGNAELKVGATDTVVFLMDVVASQKPLKAAEGKAVKPAAGLPTVTVEDGKAATITIPKGAKPPATTKAGLLIEGTGPKVAAGQTIRVTYTGALWKNGKNFDSSADSKDGWIETPIGQQRVIKAWDTQIVGKNVGSRLLLVVPPVDGYGAAGRPPSIGGTDTMVFVVDILAAY